ncbi:MAG TPA: MATE family efflux transporter [Acidimicrobiia bacterium]|nr:MATE family efflux transporter [Acidimicrobiia bacterium]
MSLARQKGVTGFKSTRKIDRRIVALALPALGALAADPLLSLVDTLFVSRLGTAELGALGVNGAIFGFAFVLFNFLAYATTPLVAQALGRGDPLEASAVVSRALWLALGLGTASMAVLATGAHHLVGLMQASGELTGPAVSYLRIRALAAPAVLVVMASHGAFRGFQDNGTPFRVALGANLANALLDPLLIFGLGWGIAGAAWASVTSQVGAAVWFLILLRRKLGLVLTRPPDLVGLSALLRTGGALTLRTLFLVGALAVGTAVAAASGTTAVAAHQVVRETWFLSAMLVDGLAIAAQALVAELTGRGDRPGARRVSKRLLAWGLAVGLVMAIGWLIGGPVLAAAFASDSEVERLIIAATRITAVMAPLAAVVWVLDGIFLGELRVKVLVASTAAGALAGLIGFLLTDLWDWGLTGVWWATAGLVGGRAVILVLAYRFGQRGRV